MKNNIFRHNNLFSEIWRQSRTVVTTIHITSIEFCNQFFSLGASVLKDDIKVLLCVGGHIACKEAMPFQSPYNPLTVLFKKAIMRFYRLKTDFPTLDRYR